jgi:3-methyladenine DNA glycosylase AlkC
MAEALKHFFNVELIRSLADEIGAVYAPLDRRRFVQDGLAGLEVLELTARGAHLAQVMRRHLPQDYEAAVGVLLASLGPEHVQSETFGMAPFRYLPHTCFVATFGLEHFETSMQAQYELTKRFTAEGSIRPFLVRYPEQTLERLRHWAADPNVHVRRLVSEGTRPRLPWAPRLRAFQEDPAPVLALLELLKDDPQRYVQRSVANNLNDIAKDHPERVVDVCRRWREGAAAGAGVAAGRQWIVGHALRSLVKKGDAGALGLLGAGAAPRIELRQVKITPRRPCIGSQVSIAFEVASTGRVAQDLMIDYRVHFVKANGAARVKVFKLKRVQLPARGALQLRSKISLADMTTRKHYAGRHALELLVNGVVFELGAFQLCPEG